MLAAGEEPGCSKVRVVVDIGDVARGAPRQVERTAQRQQLSTSVVDRQCGEQRIQVRDIGNPRLTRGKARIGNRLARAQRFQQPRPGLLGVGDDRDIAVAGGKRLAVGIDLTGIARRRVGRIVGQAGQMLDQRELGESLEHRYFDVLAFTGAQLVDDCRQRGIGGVQARNFVRDQRWGVARSGIAIDTAGKAGEPGRGLDHVVIGGLVGIRAVLPETDAVDIDDFRIQRPGRREIEAQPLQRLAPDIEHHHVAFAHQPVHRRQIVGLLEVEHRRALATVEREERRAHPRGFGGRTQPARDVAGQRGFDLENFGAQIVEDLGRVRSEHHAGQVEDLDACKHRLTVAARCRHFALSLSII